MSTMDRGVLVVCSAAAAGPDGIAQNAARRSRRPSLGRVGAFLGGTVGGEAGRLCKRQPVAPENPVRASEVRFCARLCRRVRGCF
jgi:hypothetical protein